MFFYSKYSDDPNFIDLRDFSDDKTVLENPHKGWYLHFVDNGLPRSIYRDDIAEGDYLDYIPGLKQLYLRVDWADIEKEEGSYDWSFIDQVMDDWGKHGYTFSFRFVTYEGMAHDIPYATPKWVFDKGASYILNDTRKTEQKFPFEIREPLSYEPIYDDPIFLSSLDVFLAECARKLDGNPLVESIDIGTFGTWGEGHTTSGSCKIYPLETLSKHVDLHRKHFHKTQLFLMYGFISEATKHNVDGVTPFLQKYGNCGLGLRCDSVGVGGYVKDYGYDSLQTPDLFTLFGKNAPVNIESQHLRFMTEDQMRNGLTLLEALKISGATYAGFHGYVTSWWPKYRYIHEYIANRLGYWYFLHGISFLDTCHEKLNVKLYLENKGFSRAYNKYSGFFAFVSEDGHKYDIPVTDLDNTKWAPNVPTVVDLTVSVKEIPKGKYKIYFGLKDGQRPVLFAVKSERCCDGSVLLGPIEIN